MATLVRIGENLNIMSKTIGPALKERDAGPVREMAKAEAERGVNYLDLNIGPARKDGAALMDWLVNVVREVTDLPLSLDTTSLEAMEAGLKAAGPGKALINSVSLQSSRFEKGLELAAKYKADCIALLWGDVGMPRDANERAVHVVDFIAKAGEHGIPPEKIWIDPIVTPVNVDITQVKACVECMAMLSDIAPGAKSVCGLSNVSNGVPEPLRPWLNITYLVMLMKAGLYAAIVNAFDDELSAFARGGRDTIVQRIHAVLSGTPADSGALSDTEKKYIRTVKVLTGETVFFNSWLDV